MKIILVFLVLIMTGCVTTTQLNSVPVTDEEFTQSLESIRDNHSDVELYEGFWRGYPAKLGDFDSLTEKWGEPDKVETQWGLKALGVLLHTAVVATQGMAWGVYFVVEGLFILPSEKNTWVKGNYEIEAIVTKPGILGYQDKLGYWVWKKKEVESNLASTNAN